MIKAILWDIDGTLLNFKEAEKNAIRKCFEIHGLGNCSDEMLSTYSKINVKYWEMLERCEISKPRLLVERFEKFFEVYGLPVEKAEAFNADYQVRLGDTICFEPGAPEIIEYMKARGLKQYIVTNGTKIAQDRKLLNSGIGDMVDGIFISEEIGAEKPSMVFFDQVFKTIDPENKLSKDEIIIVGDSLTGDMQGGNNAGIVSCWYNPDKKTCNLHLKLDYEISYIDELKEIIK